MTAREKNNEPLINLLRINFFTKEMIQECIENEDFMFRFRKGASQKQAITMARNLIINRICDEHMASILTAEPRYL